MRVKVLLVILTILVITVVSVFYFYPPQTSHQLLASNDPIYGNRDDVIADADKKIKELKKKIEDYQNVIENYKRRIEITTDESEKKSLQVSIDSYLILIEMKQNKIDNILNEIKYFDQHGVYFDGERGTPPFGYRIITGTNFDIYYHPDINPSESTKQQWIQIISNSFKEICRDRQGCSMSKEKIKIMIHHHQNNFQREGLWRGTAAGVASFEHGAVALLNGYINTGVVSHELCHLELDCQIARYHPKVKIPEWFQEGYAELFGHSEDVKRAIKAACQYHQLNNPGSLSDFLSNEMSIKNLLAYDLSRSLVYFLFLELRKQKLNQIEHKHKIFDFLKEIDYSNPNKYGNKEHLDKIVKKYFGFNLEEGNKKWLEWEQKYCKKCLEK